MRRLWAAGLFGAGYEGEHGSLGVLAGDDPSAAGDLHGAVHDFAAARFYTLDGCANGIDAEVECPA